VRRTEYIRRRTLRQGFTLIELLVVTTILAVLLALGLPALSRARQSAKRLECLNNLRNIALAITQFDEVQRRLPASGLIHDPPPGEVGGMHESWAVAILPFLEQTALYNAWDLNKPIDSAINAPLTRKRVPVYLCPIDISRSDDETHQGDLSYVVNGGFGFTIRTGNDVRDCPYSALNGQMDFDGDGNVCSGLPADDNDRRIFKQTGLFFLENWGGGGTVRHHTLGDVQDGTTQTLLVAENVRTGYNPDSERSGYASSHPYHCAFYVQSPCLNGNCVDGQVDYRRCNSVENGINSGVTKPEGSSSVPNSFHDGGVNVAFADGRVTFLSALIDGAVYAALASPQGMQVRDTPLRQVIVSDGSY
jgi:prepilin-type N-terminal cleavage/methylation domain-containing protein/prepilin-type processing-associated H-X9-DG protein